MEAKYEMLSDKTDIKVFILFLLDSVNYPLEYETIRRIIIENGFLETFDFTICFMELTDGGHILSEKQGETTFYRISDLGKLVATELQGSLTEPLRELSTRSAARFLSFEKRGASVKVSHTEREDGRYLLRFVIEEQGQKLLDLQMAVNSLAQVKEMEARIKDNPDGIFNGFLSALTGKIDFLLK